MKKCVCSKHKKYPTLRLSILKSINYFCTVRFLVNTIILWLFEISDYVFTAGTMVDRFFSSGIDFLRFWKHRFLRFTSFWTKGRWNFHFFTFDDLLMIFQTFWPVEASWTKFRTLSTFEHANFDSPCYHRGDFTPKLKKWSLFRLLTSHHHLHNDDFFTPFKTMNLSICYDLGYRWCEVEIFVGVDFWLFPHFLKHEKSGHQSFESGQNDGGTSM